MAGQSLRCTLNLYDLGWVTDFLPCLTFKLSCLAPSCSVLNYPTLLSPVVPCSPSYCAALYWKCIVVLEDGNYECCHAFKANQINIRRFHICSWLFWCLEKMAEPVKRRKRPHGRVLSAPDHGSRDSAWHCISSILTGIGNSSSIFVRLRLTNTWCVN